MIPYTDRPDRFTGEHPPFVIEPTVNLDEIDFGRLITADRAIQDSRSILDE